MHKQSLFQYAHDIAARERFSLLITAITLLMMTLVNVGASCVLLWESRTNASRYELKQMVILVAFSLVSIFMAATWRDMVYKKANRVQSIIGDVIQSITSDQELASSHGEGSDPNFREQEIILRHDIRTVEGMLDLPLIPGRFGPVIYLALNVLVAGYALSNALARLPRANLY